MKKIVVLVTCICFFMRTGLCYEPKSFFEFYSVFSPDTDKVIIMPDKLRIDMTLGQNENIAVVTKPENLKVLWENKTPDICDIVQTGDMHCTVYAKAPGQGELYVMHAESDVGVTVHINVHKIKPKIYLDAQKVNLKVGQTQILHAYIEPENTEEKIKWTVSASDKYAAVSVGEDVCKIRALESGSFTVSASLTDGRRAEAQIEITETGASVGYRMCIVFLFFGAAVLLISAWHMKKRMEKDEKE